MMPAWVSSALRPPPANRTVTVRFGSNIFSAAFSKWKGWVMIPGEEAITEPPLWFDHEAPDMDPEAERTLIFGQRAEATSTRRTRGPVQRELSFAPSDSGSLSRADVEARNPTGRLV